MKEIIKDLKRGKGWEGLYDVVNKNQDNDELDSNISEIRKILNLYPSKKPTSKISLEEISSAHDDIWGTFSFSEDIWKSVHSITTEVDLEGYYYHGKKEFHNDIDSLFDYIKKIVNIQARFFIDSARYKKLVIDVEHLNKKLNLEKSCSLQFWVFEGIIEKEEERRLKELNLLSEALDFGLIFFINGVEGFIYDESFLENINVPIENYDPTFIEISEWVIMNNNKDFKKLKEQLEYIKTHSELKTRVKGMNLKFFDQLKNRSRLLVVERFPLSF